MMQSPFKDIKDLKKTDIICIIKMPNTLKVICTFYADIILHIKRFFIVKNPETTEDG